MSDNEFHAVHHIKLDSGGSIALAITMDVFNLSDDDRTFVFDLIDQIREYPNGAVGEGT